MSYISMLLHRITVYLHYYYINFMAEPPMKVLKRHYVESELNQVCTNYDK